MKKFILAVLAIGMLAGCGKKSTDDFKVFAWQGEDKNATAESINADFGQWKRHGIYGVCYSAGQDTAKIGRAARIAHANGLEYHAWIPAMLQWGLDSTAYAINRNGESALTHPAYVPYYTALCPNQPITEQFLINMYAKTAEVEDVDYVHLDYIRFVDVILAKGLWNKYGLVMDEEYPAADYCYCDKCVSDFKEATGIDILTVEDPSKVEEWAKFRCGLITNLVNKICDAVHAKGKKVSAAVFPGPDSYAKWMVRQQWNEWNIDAVFPMNYNDFYLEDAAWVGKITKEEVESVEGRIPVYSGLFICKDWQNKANIADPEGHGLNPTELSETIKGAKESGAAGVALFVPQNMTEEHWKEFDRIMR
jgi:hypothetical protein